MIGIDAGLLLALFERGESPQAQAAEDLMRCAGPQGTCFVHSLVLAEMASTLENTFRLGRAQVADYIENILHAPEFTVPDAEQAVKAVERYRAGPARFSDYLLVEVNLAAGCKTTATFSPSAAESAGFTLLGG